MANVEILGTAQYRSRND